MFNERKQRNRRAIKRQLKNKSRNSFVARLETLENRHLLANFNLLAAVPDGAEGSLRAAIETANTNGENDVIRLDAGTYSLTQSNGDYADLDLTEVGQSIVLRGSGIGTTYIDATGLGDRAFDVHAGVSFVLQDVTIIGGDASPSSGGAIYNEGTLAVTNSAILESRANHGGGLYNASNGTATITDSTFLNNVASVSGGAISNAGGLLTVNGSHLVDNSASPSSGGLGGGIHNSGTATVNDSFLSGNSVRDGGAIGNTGDLTVQRSTLTNNTTTNDGAALNNISRTGSVTVVDSNLTSNRADDGGAISNAGQLNILRSTISGNSASDDGGGVLSSGAVNITDTNIVNNRAQGASGDGGGV